MDFKLIDLTIDSIRLFLQFECINMCSKTVCPFSRKYLQSSIEVWNMAQLKFVKRIKLWSNFKHWTITGIEKFEQSFNYNNSTNF